MGNFHDDSFEDDEISRAFDPVHDTRRVIVMIASGKYLADEDFTTDSPFVFQMHAVLRKLCQAWVLNHNDVEHLLGPTFFQVMKELSFEAWQQRSRKH